MRFPSTLLAKIAGKSDPKDVEREVQKADLDLLSKLNEIAGGNILTLSSTGYREKVGDNYDLVALSTGVSSQTVTLAMGKQVQGRSRIYAKADNAAGGVKLSCQGTDTIRYAGGSASMMYIGLQYQAVTLFAVSGGYILVGGATQPVSGEDSIGTAKPHFSNLVSAVPGSNAVQVLNIGPSGAGQVPAGTRAIEGTWWIQGAVSCDLYIYDAAGSNVVDAIRTQVNTIFVKGHFKCAVDSSGNIRWSTSNFAATTSVRIDMAWYYI